MTVRLEFRDHFVPGMLRLFPFFRQKVFDESPNDFAHLGVIVHTPVFQLLMKVFRKVHAEFFHIYTYIPIYGEVSTGI